MLVYHHIFFLNVQQTSNYN